MEADGFTKALARPTFEQLVTSIGRTEYHCQEHPMSMSTMDKDCSSEESIPSTSETDGDDESEIEARGPRTAESGELLIRGSERLHAFPYMVCCLVFTYHNVCLVIVYDVKCT